MFEDQVLPLINAVVFLGGAGVSSVKIFSVPTEHMPPAHKWIYLAMIVVFSVIGTTYLIFAVGVIDQEQLADVIRPSLPWVALPAYIGFFVADKDVLERWSEFSRQQKAMNEKINILEQALRRDDDG